MEAPWGSVQPIRDCCSVNSPLTSSGWARLLFKWVSFVSAPKLKPRHDRFSLGGGLMALLYAPHHAGWSGGRCPCFARQREDVAVVSCCENDADNFNKPKHTVFWTSRCLSLLLLLLYSICLSTPGNVYNLNIALKNWQH